ncbi:hypothetical protein V1227_04220 [Lentzea sp. DG1S-22]|nr:hypothetical protein [Lentzea sp. DG1S-22]WVH81964.1 hypothetical protein V1227_04220 [Lentzea sp. DG1S-22]
MTEGLAHSEARRALELARQLHFRAPDPVNSRRLAAVTERVGTP